MGRLTHGLAGALALLALTSCSFLVHFDTLQLCDGGACEDGGADSSSPDVAEDTTVVSDSDSAPGSTDSGAPDTGMDSTTAEAGPCSGKPDGFLWGSTDIDRCCNGMNVTTNQNANCGACGIVCQATQYCGVSPLSNGQYLCLGCTQDVQCWSGHCAQDEIVSGSGATVDAGSHCAVERDDAGDCLDVCPSGTPPGGMPPCCPAGSRCAMPVGVLLNYCTYDDAG